jgi:hypothetical protein
MKCPYAPIITATTDFREESTMQIPILIEPIEGGRYRIRTGEPFGLVAEGENYDAAVQALQCLIAARLSKGSCLGVLNVPNGISPTPSSLPFPADALYMNDPSFAEMQQDIAAFRRTEDEAEERQLKEPTPGAGSCSTRIRSHWHTTAIRK